MGSPKLDESGWRPKGLAKIVTRLEWPRKGRRAWPSAGYVVLELVNGEFLLIDHRFDEVADRNEAYDAAVLDDGQVADSGARS